MRCNLIKELNDARKLRTATVWGLAEVGVNGTVLILANSKFLANKVLSIARSHLL